jgi:hypothetical protein
MEANERIGLEVRARDLGIDPDGVEDADLQSQVEAAEVEAKSKDESTGKKKKTRFWRSSIAGLRVHSDANTSLRFTPFIEKYQGDDTKVGYLESSDRRVNDLCEDDPNVTEIEKAEFEKATGESAKRGSY